MKRTGGLDPSGTSTAAESSGSHLNKRPRLVTEDANTSTSSDVSPEDIGLTRDEEFWYDDGSVVLIAQDVAFCVYRGWLARRSEVFSGMFSIPQQPGDERICGCPVVRLPETAGALRELLYALFFGKIYDPSNDAELHSLSYRIRLAHKYSIDDLLEQSLGELKRHFPTTLTAWDAVPREYSARAITAVNLARLTETPSILPSALYICCQLPEDTLLSGTAHPDGTPETLSREDLVRCLAARLQLCQCQMNVAYDALRAGSCKGGVCVSALDRLCSQAVEHAETRPHRADPLMRWNVFIDARVGGRGQPCNDCVAAIHDRIEELRVVWWLELPVFTDVDMADDWDA